MSSKDEKNLLKDIDMLKRALPELQKLTAIEPELAQIREERKKISAELDIYKKLIDEREDTIQDFKSQSQA
jgi:DNA repair ATPase RecN